VISITDGQIFLESNLFYSGIRPAINVGISVSRVGGNAQTKAIKQVAGRLKMDMAQYYELAAFAQFGAELDKASMAQLNRGARIVELLKQSQFAPYSLDEQVAAIFAAVNGFLDPLPMERVKAFELEMLKYLKSKHSGLLKTIREAKMLTDDTTKKLMEAVQEFAKGFPSSERRAETR